MPAHAAIDVYLNGSVYTEISSQPEDVLRAGNRVKLYSEIVLPGNNQLKFRIWGVNQKGDYLNRFDSSFSLSLMNQIDWIEVQTKGNLFPSGPEMELSFGNIEVDYSPYSIAVKDQAFNDYIYEPKSYYGVTIRNIKWRYFQFSAFGLTGITENPSKNMFGGLLEFKKNKTVIKGIYLDYANRGARTIAEEESEKVFELSLERDYGWGTINCVVVSQKNNHYEQPEGTILAVEDKHLLKDFAFKLPINDNVAVTFGYRDYPKDFNPVLRDRTAEFDDRTGIYLGFNPVDRYGDRKGIYSIVDAEIEGFKFRADISNYENHLTNPTRYQEVGLSMCTQLKNWTIDIFGYTQNRSTFLNTNDSDLESFSFTRAVFSYPKTFSTAKITPGIEFRAQDDKFDVTRLISYFVKYEVDNMLSIEGGLRQGLISNSNSGPYLRFDYKSPNGLKISHYYSSAPLTKDDGKFYYDPDYRILKPDNLTKVSIEMEF